MTDTGLLKHWDTMGTPDTTRRRPTSHNGPILTNREGPSVSWIPEGWAENEAKAEAERQERDRQEAERERKLDLLSVP